MVSGWAEEGQAELGGREKRGGQPGAEEAGWTVCR